MNADGKKMETGWKPVLRRRSADLQSALDSGRKSRAEAKADYKSALLHLRN